jgi:cytochrome c oxidase subunit 2
MSKPGAVGLVLLAGCEGTQSVLDPAGIQADRVEGLWWFMLIVATTVFVLVIGALAFAVARRRSDRSLTPGEESRQSRRINAVIMAATGATVLTLFAFLVVNFSTERALRLLPRPDSLSVRVIGHQWWWEVRYPNTSPSLNVVTANEIHIPVGVPVKISLSATDVIHSLWVPQLGGKRDLIPGHDAETWIRADSAGRYRGQCAEFCGHQHAKMALVVVAQPRAEFDAWLDAQRQPADTPTTAQQIVGKDVFMSSTCALCHGIRGTDAGGTVAPDLTHLASRSTIASGTLPNTREHLANWIRDPQSIKPGVKMPATPLDSAQLGALVAYLGTLR